jgi:tRNA(adenine34) deaminase
MKPHESQDAVAPHESYMRRCIELAQIALRQNNTPVGSIVVLDGEIIGEGIETLPTGNSITRHAEILACQAAVKQTGTKTLTGATLYSTAEPCFMCAYAIRQAGISLVVYGSETPEIGGVTSSHPILTNPRLTDWKPAPQIIAGILQQECQQIKKNE